MNIPWKLKSLAFRILSGLPSGALYFAQRHITGRSRLRLTNPSDSWHHHRKVIQETGAKTLIEFGAGKSLVQNLYLSDVIPHQTVVDLNPMLELGLVNEVIAQLKALGCTIDGRPVRSLDELEEIYGIRYLAPFDMRNSGFEAASFDICVSTNTLEHIPRDDIAAIFRELARIIRPGGLVSAVIDYSDHYAHSDRSIGRLNYLIFSEQDWVRYNHSNHYQNRMRHNHYGEIFQAAGFQRDWDEPVDFADPDGLELRPELCTGAASDHATRGYWRLSPRAA